MAPSPRTKRRRPPHEIAAGEPVPKTQTRERGGPKERDPSGPEGEPYPIESLAGERG